MTMLNLPLGLFIGVLIAMLGFIVFGPKEWVSKAFNFIGNLIQKIVAWIKNLFS